MAAVLMVSLERKAPFIRCFFVFIKLLPFKEKDTILFSYLKKVYSDPTTLQLAHFFSAFL